MNLKYKKLKEQYDNILDENERLKLGIKHYKTMEEIEHRAYQNSITTVRTLMEDVQKLRKENYRLRVELSDLKAGL